MDDKDISELLKAVLGMYARQLAILDLLKQTGVKEADIQGALSRAKARLSQVPRLAYLQTPNPSNFQGLAELLESIR